MLNFAQHYHELYVAHDPIHDIKLFLQQVHGDFTMSKLSRILNYFPHPQARKAKRKLILWVVVFFEVIQIVSQQSVQVGDSLSHILVDIWSI